MNNVYNFNAGPAALPKEVLLRAQKELINFDDTGMSIMEMSHRSDTYDQVHSKAITQLTSMLGLSDEFHVLFLQGGASLQFSMVPMNFMKQQANYVLTGSWSEKAEKEAVRYGQTSIGASSKHSGYRSIPEPQAILYSPEDSYMHLTSNNTLFGTQWTTFPTPDIPLICDMSSDIFSREIDYNQFDLIYAGAQKNLGPSGVTVVLIKDSLLQEANKNVPSMLSYQTFAHSRSLYNTPPVFSIYMLGLVLDWTEQQGGLNKIEEQNRLKSAILYDAIDRSDGFYKGHADQNSRSQMNITFTLKTKELTELFLQEAKEAGFVGLAGHRSVGGLRASIYNAVPLESCEALAAFMKLFNKNHLANKSGLK
ncbi:3-phosphoserine/phosphohydroxythreonine transaminase [Shouchella patagoniensis]|uniref:3-phosphoserine/phosphohydroxythreonine transaminase n=1 Tax=Shouchella patagoniensis TaxID=228576 RepID=UPI000994BD5A|nr:3-phosphoserine/phosphohydroxythreonine transaminase [Shouchella patagoniensis]